MPPGGMHGPGPRAGPPGKAANVGDDKWGKRSLPPPPPGMGGGAMGNLPALHQAEKKFKVPCSIIPWSITAVLLAEAWRSAHASGSLQGQAPTCSRYVHPSCATCQPAHGRSKVFCSWVGAS